jgi:hypothetical protein
MKPAKLMVMVTMVLGLSLLVVAQNPPQVNSERDDLLEAAHAPVFSTQDAAAEAGRLTEAASRAIPGTGAAYEPIARKNYIDDFIFGRIEDDNIPHAPLATDAKFLRRAYLDATGLLPSVDEARAFLSDTDPNKRDKLIDALVGTEAYAEQWAYHYGEVFRTDDTSFHLWTKEWIWADRPYDEVFYDIVTPTTKSAATLPQAQYYDPAAYIANRCIIWTDADHLKGFNRLDWIDEVTSDLGRVFLGITMDCFSCHNGAGHADTFNLFLASQRRTDFWQQAAFFGTLRPVGNAGSSAGAQFQNGQSSFDDFAGGYNTGLDGNFVTVSENRFPRDGRTYEPAFLLTGETPREGENPRKALGRIMPTHVQFARAAVNLIWKKLMVVGLVEPYDGFDLLRLDPANPPPEPWTIQPSNPALLEALAADFRDNGLKLQHMIKTIMKSNAYQLSTRFEGEWQDGYSAYHARRFARILTGPEAADIMSQATGSPFENGYVKSQTLPNRAGRDISNFMSAYYQGGREAPPVDKTMATPMQAMMMMSSIVVTDRVTSQGDTRVANLLASDLSDEDAIEELFLAGLTRYPGAEEVTVANRVIAARGRAQGLEEIQWSVLNSPEFLLNH